MLIRRGLHHDGAISPLAQADQLVVLPDHLGSTFGEVESEGCLVRTKVVDVEDELLRKILWRAEDHPAHTRVDL